MYSWITKTAQQYFIYLIEYYMRTKKYKIYVWVYLQKHITILSCLATKYFFAEI